MPSYGAKKVLFAPVTRYATLRPLPPRMKHIPGRPLLSIATLTGVMIAEAVNHAIPDWGELTNQHGLTEWNPNVIDHEVATLEIREVEIPSLFDGFGMLAQAIVEDLAWRDIQANSTFPCAGGYRFADVHRHGVPGVPVSLDKRAIRFEVPHIVDRVNARTHKGVPWRKGKNRSVQKGLGHTDSKIALVERIVGCFYNHASLVKTLLATTSASRTGTALPSCRMASLQEPRKR